MQTFKFFFKPIKKDDKILNLRVNKVQPTVRQLFNNFSFTINTASWFGRNVDSVKVPIKCPM